MYSFIVNFRYFRVTSSSIYASIWISFWILFQSDILSIHLLRSARECLLVFDSVLSFLWNDASAIATHCASFSSHNTCTELLCSSTILLHAAPCTFHSNDLSNYSFDWWHSHSRGIYAVQDCWQWPWPLNLDSPLWESHEHQNLYWLQPSHRDEPRLADRWIIFFVRSICHRLCHWEIEPIDF